MAATTMQLEFEQAMTDFKTMFPDMDLEVIEAILRSNKGAVDSTIDQLLAMSTDNQNEKLRNEMDHGSSHNSGGVNCTTNAGPRPASASPINTPERLRHHRHDAVDSLLSVSPSPLVSLAGSPKTNGGASPKITPTASKWKPAMLSPLPATFLRLNGSGGPSSSTGGGVGVGDLELPDEQFAMMLQNEEFMNELRWNPEFMLALEKEQQGSKGKGDDDAAFRDRVKNMGKMSRKKFQQLAKKFTWQKNKKIGAVRHPDSLLLQEEHSDDDEPRRGASPRK